VKGRALLVDREREVAELRRLAASGQKQLAILYGRRQIGKTHLLSHAWSSAGRVAGSTGAGSGDVRVFYFLAAALTPDLNRQDLVRELAAWSGQALDPADYPTWRTVFRELFGLAEDGPLVVVLDEFQYLLGAARPNGESGAAGTGRAGGDEVTSQLVAVWDRAPRTLPLTLVLSGSEVSAMGHLHAGGEPLYGRVTWAAQLQAFDYWDAGRMAPWLGLRDRAILYGVFGGTPRYLAALDEGESLAAGASRTFVSPHGEVHLQLLTLIEQEKGIRQPAEYRAVLTAVASGDTQLGQIMNTTGLEQHVVRRALGVLADLGVVRAERNFGAGPKAPYRNLIADHAVGFWHRFLVPHRSHLATNAAGEPRRFWNVRVTPYLDTYMGRPFETIVRQAFDRQHWRLGLPPAREWGRWEGHDRTRGSVEVDIAARLEDGRLLAGDIKWSSSPHGPGLHGELLGKLARLAASGYGWAQDVDDSVLLYVSAAGFTPRMQALAAADTRVRLLSLAGLYEPEVATGEEPAVQTSWHG
jgi:AAA+ ATPase superfamily predicted ATPase